MALYNKCKRCKKVRIQSRYVYCSNCWTIVKDKDITLGECVYSKNDANRFSKVRFRGRLVARKLGLLNECYNCGYSIHVEACHIKDVCDFDFSVMVSVINSKKNLIGLCRNCHWEFDHGLLAIKGIKRKRR